MTGGWKIAVMVSLGVGKTNSVGAGLMGRLQPARAMATSRIRIGGTALREFIYSSDERATGMAGKTIFLFYS
jgi:hypothetical protein